MFTSLGVQAYRTFPQSLGEDAKLPAIFTLPEASANSQATDRSQLFTSVRTFTIFLVVQDWMLQLPTESTQQDVENIMDTIELEIHRRPQLSLSVNDSLDNVYSAFITGDTGIQNYRFQPALSSVEYSLQVQTNQTVQLIR